MRLLKASCCSPVPALGTAAAATPGGLAALEDAYADFNDAQGAVSLIDSDPARFPQQSYAGRTRAQWSEAYVTRRAQLTAGLPRIVPAGLSAQDVTRQ